jgi:hypothetical protein
VGVQLLCGEALQSHPRLALGVDAQEQVLPQIGGRRKLIEALSANEYGGQCGVWRPETSNSISIRAQLSQATSIKCEANYVFYMPY